MKHKLEKGESSGLPALSWNTARMASRSIKKKKKSDVPYVTEVEMLELPWIMVDKGIIRLRENDML